MTDLRTIERDSIRAFVQSAADEGYLSGRVLDYGCGKQPYRDIVEAAGGEYVPFDAPTFPASVAEKDTTGEGWMQRFDTVLCTQVVQYVPNVHAFLYDLCVYRMPVAEEPGGPRKQGHLVLTYPTNWPEVEQEDLHRFTKAGMERLLTETGFEIIRHQLRALFDPWGGFITPVPPEASDEAVAHNTPRDALAFGYGVIARA